jgi:hydroxypyruvate isomerase
MPRFAANLSMMYTEVPFMQRFEAAARDGFKAVEFLFPYEFSPAEVRAALKTNELEQALFNAPPGDFAGGERGLASLPGREAEFAAGLDRAIEYAVALECPRVHIMAGLVKDPTQRAAQRAVYVSNLKLAARRLAQHGLTTLIEPINTRDIPGFFLNTQAEAHAIRAEVGEPSLKVQMDLYHCQIVEGDVSMRLRQWFDGVGHIQIAGVPQRHEPDIGEVNYPYLFGVLDELGYEGWVGCEYRPRGKTSEGLGWLRDWLARSR